MGLLSKWYFNSGCDFPSQSVCRTLMISVILCLLHSCGILISIYFLLTRLLESDKTEKPFHHVCTSALLCPFYRIFAGLAGISVQLGGSIMGLVINLSLLLGVFYSATWAILIWLVSYIFAICGCLILFGVVLNILIVRGASENDISLGTYFVSLIPLLLAIVYIFCWAVVFRLWRKMRLRDSQIFVCIE